MNQIATVAKIAIALLINNALKANAKKTIILSSTVKLILIAWKIKTTKCAAEDNVLNFLKKKTK